MKKIPTLFKRVYKDNRIIGILPEVTEGMEWIFNGEGVGVIYIPIKYCPECGRKLGE